MDRLDLGQRIMPMKCAPALAACVASSGVVTPHTLTSVFLPSSFGAMARTAMDRADLWARVDARDVDRCVDAATRVGASAARWCIARDACIVDVCVRVVGRRGGSRCLLVLSSPPRRAEIFLRLGISRKTRHVRVFIHTRILW